MKKIKHFYNLGYKIKIYAEYDDTNNLIATFKIDRFAYRVNKYNFNEFWFD